MREKEEVTIAVSSGVAGVQTSSSKLFRRVGCEPDHKMDLTNLEVGNGFQEIRLLYGIPRRSLTKLGTEIILYTLCIW